MAGRVEQINIGPERQLPQPVDRTDAHAGKGLFGNRYYFDDGDAPYHLTVTATEVFPTGVIRVIYAPAETPAKVSYDDVRGKVPEGHE